jgi:hypothetical protein
MSMYQGWPGWTLWTLDENNDGYNVIMSGHYAIMSTSVHYKNRHYKMAVLDDFSEMCMYIWMKNGKFRLKN